MKHTNKQYATYIPQFKVSSLFKIFASSLTLLSLLLFLFLPTFQLSLGNITFTSFSFFDLFKNVVDNFLNSSISLTDMSFFSNYFYLFAIVYGAVAIVMIIVDIIKSISRIFDLDSYALETYDQIKSRIDVKENKKRRPFNPASMLWGTLIFFIMGAFFEKMMSSVLIQGDMESSSSALAISDILFDFHCYSIPMVCILAIVFISTIVVSSLSGSYEKKLSLAIIKEDYGIEEPDEGPTTTAKSQSTFEQIKKLKELLDMGAITQEEFELQKQKILHQNTSEHPE